MSDIKARAESRWDSNFRSGVIAVVWVVTGAMLIVAGVSDASGENELLFVAVAAPFAVTMVLIGAAVGAWRHLLVACAVLALWLAVLPKIRWGPVKVFYMACRRVEPGMPVARVKGIMARYRLRHDAEPDGMTFILDRDHPADWCTVHVAGHVVQAVDVSD